ncbi:MAG TPA: molybdopterin molybdotransferase MoeA, partial [Noviherbaspirillum sp.]|nr:molybdopterin molybdotransferase MoeA [Noviherbaspirillum sp.]
MLDAVQPLTGSETAPLRQARMRVLAEALVSPIDVPAHDNSAMDGYAFDGAKLTGGRMQLTVAGTALAGQPYKAVVKDGECVRIMTGAMMPPGCDTVIPLEATQSADGVVRFATADVKRGANRRLRGEDLARGQEALARGRLLRAADLGLAASLGVPALPVLPRVRVAYFSTGDELREPGSRLDEGCVYDSNRYTLTALLEQTGCEVIDLGAVADDPKALADTLTRASMADAIITSGGAAAGDADHTAKVMASMGEVLFWRLAMKPGRPFAFGRIAG